jgi:hypothetical protein
MNSRQRKAREAYERQKETYEFIKQKEAEEKKNLT